MVTLMVGWATGDRRECQKSPASSGSSFACSPSLRRRITGHTSMRTTRMRLASSPSMRSKLIGGNLPRGQQRLVEAWAEIHQRELLDDWERLQAGRPPLKIEPLR